MIVATRVAREADLPRLVELLWDDEQGGSRESLLKSALAAYRAAFRAMNTDAACTLLVALDGEAVCGCLQLTVLSGLSFQGMRRGLIEDVRVARTHRRRGVGERWITPTCVAGIERRAVDAEQRRTRIIDANIERQRVAEH